MIWPWIIFKLAYWTIKSVQRYTMKTARAVWGQMDREKPMSPNTPMQRCRTMKNIRTSMSLFLQIGNPWKGRRGGRDNLRYSHCKEDWRRSTKSNWMSSRRGWARLIISPTSRSRASIWMNITIYCHISKMGAVSSSRSCPVENLKRARNVKNTDKRWRIKILARSSSLISILRARHRSETLYRIEKAKHK